MYTQVVVIDVQPSKTIGRLQRYVSGHYINDMPQNSHAQVQWVKIVWT